MIGENNVKVHLKDARKLKFYTFIEYEYSTITILDDYNIIAFCTPSYDILKPWKWTLLLHEIGHTMFNAKIDTYVMKFREKILPILRDLAPSSVRTQVAAYLKLWEQKWLKEFVSDLYGVTVGVTKYVDEILKKYYLSLRYVPIALRQIFRKNGLAEFKRLLYSARSFIDYIYREEK